MTKIEFLTKLIGTSYHMFESPILDNEPIWALLNVRVDYHIYCLKADEDKIVHVSVQTLSEELSSDGAKRYAIVYLCEQLVHLKNEVQPVSQKSELGFFKTPEGKSFGKLTSDDQIISYNGLMKSDKLWEAIPKNQIDPRYINELIEEDGETIYIAFRNGSDNLYRITIWTNDELIAIAEEISVVYVVADENTIIHPRHKETTAKPQPDNTIWDLEMHKGMKVNEDLWITRVPGGWMYESISNGEATSSTFVPWVDQVHNKGCTLCGNTKDKTARTVIQVLDYLNKNQASIDEDDDDKLLQLIKDYL